MPLADHLQISPLLYNALKSQTQIVPRDVLKQLHACYIKNTYRNTILLHGLSVTAEFLQDAGVEVMALKGAALAESVYDNIALRYMDDIDIMVKKEDLTSAIKLLFQKGFIIKEHPSHLYHIPDELKHFPTLYHPQMKFKLDLHCSIDYGNSPLNIELSRLWQNAVPIKISGRPMKALAPVDLILCLCLHLAYHDLYKGGLKYLCDISWIIRSCNQSDWNNLRIIAKAWGMTKGLDLSLALATDVLKVHIPYKLKPMQQQGFAQERVWGDKIMIARPLSFLSRWRNAYGLRHKLKLIRHSLYPTKEFMEIKYKLKPGSKKIYLCYIVSPFELVMRVSRYLYFLSGYTKLKTMQSDADEELKLWVSICS